ncbi:TetR/AcrR family transcriptional regulator [Ornithobacterium rhinotracheale]|uniref:TetR/AcrR family transcriptional regulator n=1 Tax=Ornithobacterium rhinotracheale TaxID=28251 RepID=UPI001FF2F409|nr:TetR/AcrR family transcriptional regulator [Ornithobacterium rhinotracheale]MCK0204965.1 TetR/AcrR family transcriptional regulator [Ornithobacterium rhinotracheale]
MARITDRSKIAKIHESIIDTVVAEGIKNASVAKIAREAGVSTGYLYRFYPGKEELIQAIYNDLFKRNTDMLSQLLEKEERLEFVISKFISFLFDQANNHPNHVLFFLKLMTDYSFQLRTKESNILIEICEKALSLGLKTKEIREEMTPEILYTVIVGTTFFLINLRKRRIFKDSSLTTDDINMMTKLYTKALA